MKRRFFGIFGKIFFYTILILFLVLTVIFIFFSDQIRLAVELTQRQQLADIFKPLLSQLEDKSKDEIIEFAKEFHEKNSYFDFVLESNDGQILYQTKDLEIPDKIKNLPDTIPSKFIIDKENTMVRNGLGFLMTNGIMERFRFLTLNVNGMKLYISGNASGASIYLAFLEKMILAFVLIFIASLIAAAIFARRIAKPIQRIAADAKKMSGLEPVAEPGVRKDEIGQLAGDVYKMYRKLKGAIGQLEEEITREKEMEENQRYFFSAASHELKTPIAATSAIMEGMLEQVIEPGEYPIYLRECLKMAAEQNKLISEILEIVQLSNASTTSEKEKIALNKLVTEILPIYKTIADSKAQTLDADIPDNLSCTVDKKLLGRVLSNIIINAVQNTPEGGRIKIFTEDRDTDLAIRLCILNRDVKIAEDILPKLFLPFYREDKARSRGQGHSGLGLTIVQRALRKMEIPFGLENTAEGVLFWMELPR